MDAIAALKEILGLANDITTAGEEDDITDSTQGLAEGVQGLHAWLAGGGFLPAAWGLREAAEKPLRYPTLKDAAQAALDVQDACNLSGVAIAFAEVMRTICAYVDSGTEARNRHPIVRVWLDKMNQLAGIQCLSHGVTMDDWNHVARIAKEGA